MSEERITERTDGVTSERVVERGEAAPTHTTVIERRGGGGGIFIGIVLLIAVLIGAYFLLNQSESEARRDDAIAGAAKSVGDSAEKAGDAITDAVDGDGK